MEVLGHSTANLTLGTYSNVVDELMDSAAHAMSRGLLAGVPLQEIVVNTVVNATETAGVVPLPGRSKDVKNPRQSGD